MKTIIRKGWDMTVRHKYVVVLLFLYRLLWGFLLYRFVDSIATPILARYPDPHPNAQAARLFWIEAEFRLLKTDLAGPVLWTLAGMLLLRMLLTPVLSAGMYYSFRHASEERGTQVLAGMRRAWKPVALLYWAEMALTLAPAAWLVPTAKARFFGSIQWTDWLSGLLPYAAGWFAWGLAVHVLLQAMQFGAASGSGAWKGLWRALQRALPLAGVTLLLLGASAFASAAAAAASFVWTGFAAIAIQQSFHFVRSLMSLWTAASQYQAWKPDAV
jgi:hypothetical protein